MKDPAVEFAVKVLEVATPEASVVTVSVAVPVLANVPLAPDPGAENVTEVPGTGVLPESSTTTVRTEEYAVEMVAL